MGDVKGDFSAWFQSVADTDERYPLDEVIYKSKDGHLLEVCHDLEALKKVPAEKWKRNFEKRSRRTEWPYGSGVWGKKEWVLPGIDPKNGVSMYEGHTKLFWADRYGAQIGIGDRWLKQCGDTPTVSVKDRVLTGHVSMVKRRGTVGEDKQGGA